MYNYYTHKRQTQTRRGDQLKKWRVRKHQAEARVCLSPDESSCLAQCQHWWTVKNIWDTLKSLSHMCTHSLPNTHNITRSQSDTGLRNLSEIWEHAVMRDPVFHNTVQERWDSHCWDQMRNNLISTVGYTANSEFNCSHLSLHWQSFNKKIKWEALLLMFFQCGEHSVDPLFCESCRLKVYGNKNLSAALCILTSYKWLNMVMFLHWALGKFGQGQGW